MPKIVIILNVSFRGGGKLDVNKDFVPVGITQTFRNINQKEAYSIITILPSLFYSVYSPTIHWITIVRHTSRPRTVYVAVCINKNKNKNNPLPPANAELWMVISIHYIHVSCILPWKIPHCTQQPNLSKSIIHAVKVFRYKTRFWMKHAGVADSVLYSTDFW